MAELLYKGTLNELPFPEILGKLYIEKLSGVLRLTRRSGMGYKEIYVRSGLPIYVGGTYIIEKECLGQLLKMAGKITSHDLSRSIDLVKQGKLQGDALIQLGIINSKILTGVLKWQAELKLAEMSDFGREPCGNSVLEIAKAAEVFFPSVDPDVSIPPRVVLTHSGDS